jgi:two-component system response regulator HydG
LHFDGGSTVNLMAERRNSVLLVDDDPDMREAVHVMLERRGLQVEIAESASAALDKLSRSEIDVIVTDVVLGEGSMGGIELCRQAAEKYRDVPVIVVTGHANLDYAVEAIRAGAYDFILKPFSNEALLLAIDRAVRHRRLTAEMRRLREASGSTRRPAAIIGDSPAIRQVLELVEQVADSRATVLITGESGTGKELVARALHERSSRASAPFVAVNCAAMPATLLESELFGHVRGAFTDARRSRPGLFVQAGEGTLFLDEIGEITPEIQVKLLRVLQERKLRPVGGDTEVPFAARLVAATNRDLQAEVDAGRFRADLYYRINVVRIDVPPLRRREGDVLLLAQHFLRRHAQRNNKQVEGISAPAARRLLDYGWPGNVRELENCIERAVALAKYSEITVDDLPDALQQSAEPTPVVTENPEDMPTLDEMQRQYIHTVIEACQGNKTLAARVLGLDRRALYRRLHQLGLMATPARAENGPAAGPPPANGHEGEAEAEGAHAAAPEPEPPLAAEPDSGHAEH